MNYKKPLVSIRTKKKKKKTSADLIEECDMWATKYLQTKTAFFDEAMHAGINYIGNVGAGIPNPSYLALPAAAAYSLGNRDQANKMHASAREHRHTSESFLPRAGSALFTAGMAIPGMMLAQHYAPDMNNFIGQHEYLHSVVPFIRPETAGVMGAAATSLPTSYLLGRAGAEQSISSMRRHGMR
jgi:hypothetical protein